MNPTAIQSTFQCFCRAKLASWSLLSVFTNTQNSERDVLYIDVIPTVFQWSPLPSREVVIEGILLNPHPEISTIVYMPSNSYGVSIQFVVVLPGGNYFQSPVDIDVYSTVVKKQKSYLATFVGKTNTVGLIDKRPKGWVMISLKFMKIIGVENWVVG